MNRTRRVSAGRRTLGTAVATVLLATTVIAGADEITGQSEANAGSATVSGEPVPRGDLPGWKQIFVDEFGTDVPLGQFPAKVSKKWDAYPSPWKDSTRRGTYSPEKVVSIKNGKLTKHVRHEGGQNLIAAIVPKITDEPSIVKNGNAKYGQLYGRYSVRFRIDDFFRGYKIAWLQWPDVGTETTGSIDGIGGNGEIDYPEADLNGDVEKVMAFVHKQNATVGHDQHHARVDVDVREWHTYTLEWSPNLVVVYFDGQEVRRFTERIPKTAMHWVLQTETSIKERPLNTDEGRIHIDWVAAWAYDPGNPGGGNNNGTTTTTTTAPNTTVPTVTFPPPTTAPPVTAPPVTAPPVALPTVIVKWPGTNATWSGWRTVKTNFLNMNGVVAVKWFVDGKQVAYDADGWPWEQSINTRNLSNGRHKIVSKAKTADGKWLTSSGKTFTVNN